MKSKNNNNTQRYLDIMNQWLILKQNNIRLEKFLNQHNYKKIAIYGMGIYGRHLVREFYDSSDVYVVCGIDKKKMPAYQGVKIQRLSEVKDKIDVVINTIFYDEVVKKYIEKELGCDVISFEDLVFESYTL